MRFPEVASSVVHILMDFLSDANVDAAVDVVVFVREVMEIHRGLREELLHKLAGSLRMIRAGAVFRCALWILGEYAESKEDVDACLTGVRKVLGDAPFTPQKEGEEGEEEPKDAAVANGHAAAPKVASRVLADGTYATQSAHAAEVIAPHIALARQHPLRCVCVCVIESVIEIVTLCVF